MPEIGWELLEQLSGSHRAEADARLPSGDDTAVDHQLPFYTAIEPPKPAFQADKSSLRNWLCGLGW
jgi:hypothetical protein